MKDLSDIYRHFPKANFELFSLVLRFTSARLILGPSAAKEQYSIRRVVISACLEAGFHSAAVRFEGKRGLQALLLEKCSSVHLNCLYE